jgi:crotonobetainyl-CoA:carnitine CoA-transferase CaiB-like acyl-CoA transferase
MSEENGSVVPSSLPLAGIRVIDMSVVWAGTFTTMMLADMGAEVIRVENTRFAPYGTRGITLRPSDALLSTRGMATAGYPDRKAGERPYNRAAMFNVHARNKLSMTVDYMNPRGLAILKKLIGISDLFVENNAYGTMAKLGLGYDEVRKVKPDIIMVSMPAFGNSGPSADRIALGRHLEAVAGHTLLRGYPNADPTWTTEVYHCDAAAGAMGAFAAMTALHHRQRTGKGQFIDVAQIEALIPQLGEAIMDFTLNGRVQGPLGNRHPTAAPCGLYPCQGEDRWIAITVFSEREWKGLCRAMGSPAWTEQAKFSDRVGRWQNQDELDEQIAAWTRGHRDYDLMHLLQGEGVAAGPVMDERDCYSDPHIRERKFFEEVTHVECGTHLYPGMEWKFSKTPGSIRRPPCRLGEHNRYVYRDLLGISESEYADLEREGHIGMDYHPSITVHGRATE